MTTLEIDTAVKRYPNGFVAVKGVSVSIGDGELVVFVGPSGCGKSTLLRMVAGLETVTEGEIRLKGKVVNKVEPADRNIAMVFQNYALYPHMTVKNNLSYGLRNRKMPAEEIERRVTEAAALLQIDQLLARKPNQLSGGQRQRVAMGRALVRDPDVFLFDEPLSNLDAKLRNQMRLEIKRLQQRLQTAAIYVTHDQVEAMTMADKIVVLNEGEIEQVGTPNEVYSHPASTFVASFIGAPPMNLVPAEIAADGVHVGDVTLPLTGLAPGHATLGVRPEKVRLGPAGQGPAFPIEVVEELGANRLIHGQLGGQPFTANISAEDVLPADTPSVVIESRDLHLFDRSTGKRL